MQKAESAVEERVVVGLVGNQSAIAEILNQIAVWALQKFAPGRFDGIENLIEDIEKGVFPALAACFGVLTHLSGPAGGVVLEPLRLQVARKLLADPASVSRPDLISADECYETVLIDKAPV